MAQRLRKERDRDSEGVVLVDGDLTKGSLLISFEQNASHRALWHRQGRNLPSVVVSGDARPKPST